MPAGGTDSTELIGVREGAARLGKSKQMVQKLCSAGRIRGLVFESGRWWMPADPEIIPIDEHKGTQGMLNGQQAAKRLGISKARVCLLCKNGRIEGAVKVGKEWAIPDPPVILPAAKSS